LADFHISLNGQRLGPMRFFVFDQKEVPLNYSLLGLASITKLGGKLDLEKKQLALRGLDGKYKTHLYSTKQFSSLHPQLGPGGVAARISKDNGQTVHHIGECTCLLSVVPKREGRGGHKGPRGSNLDKVEVSRGASGQRGVKILVTNVSKNSQDVQNDQILVTVDPKAPEAQNTQND
jgi:hypothetical protein